MGGAIMKYFRLHAYTIFDNCDYNLVFAFADDTPDEEIAVVVDVEFNKYMCAFSTLLGDPASYTNIEEYDKTLDYYVRNTDYDIIPITKEEFEQFENCDQVKN